MNLKGGIFQPPPLTNTNIDNFASPFHILFPSDQDMLALCSYDSYLQNVRIEA